MSTLIPRVLHSPSPRPARIHGYLSVNSKGGVSVLDAKSAPERSDGFHGSSKDIDATLKVAAEHGLEVIAMSPLGVAVAGAPEAYEQFTGGQVVTKEVLVYAEAATRRYVTHVDIVGHDQPAQIGCARPASKKSPVEAVILERPRSTQATVVPAVYSATVEEAGGIWPSPIPPIAPGFYLRVPQDVAVGLGAPAAHQRGFMGQGVTVAMVDTGHYLHPFFTAHHYNVKTPISVVHGANQHEDPIGHGTGESANIFAAAPSAILQPIRASNTNGDLVGAIAGFMKAKALKPRVLTNSWGGDLQYPPVAGEPSPDDLSMALEIKHAVESGIFVVFSAGNGQFSIEPQVPEAFAAGGVYMGSNMALRASNYASGYPSPFHPGRNVPDACGLVGLLPRATYIMLPISPGCQLDVEMAKPDEQGNAGDGTTQNDGWALFSGTSAAAPQIAGVAAILLSAKPSLTPAQIKTALTATAVDVTTGRCHPRFNFAAASGPDVPTGAGLVNAGEALQYALAHF